MRNKPLHHQGTLYLVLTVFLVFVSAGCGSDGPTGDEPASLSDLFGNELYRGDGTPVGIQALNGKALIGIYFASPGCPACGAFTPLLVEAYDEIRESGRSFEVVLVSPGISESYLFEYMTESEMGWLAVSSQSNRANNLAQRYNIRWIPTLVIIDGAARLVSLTGREEVTEKGGAAYEDWLAAGAGG